MNKKKGKDKQTQVNILGKYNHPIKYKRKRLNEKKNKKRVFDIRISKYYDY